MNTILNNILEKLNNDIRNFYFNAELSIEDVENFYDDTVKSAIKTLVAAHYERIDEEVYADKANRKVEGLVVERKNNRRQIFTKLGMLEFKRTYYQNKSGGYCYPVDAVAGLEGYERLSHSISESLVKNAINYTYEHASDVVTEGVVSKQTVMRKVRQAEDVQYYGYEQKQVPVIHIDADEDHINLQSGGNAIAPIISVYEGIGRKGKRRYCKNIFHNSFFNKNADDIWEEVLNRIEARYDLYNTKIYLHGDGAAWIKKGLEWLPNVEFVLDRYHLNKYIKLALTGLEQESRTQQLFKLRKALNEKDISEIKDVWKYVINNTDSHDIERINEAFKYLMKNIDGIAIYKKDSEASNGGATEPHVSHVLSSRLSSRPKGWSEETLEHLVPLRTALEFRINRTKPEVKEIVKEKTKKIKKRTGTVENTLGLVNPDIAMITQTGKITPIGKLIKSFCD